MKRGFSLWLLGWWAAPVLAATLTFTAIPDEDESRLVARFNPLATYLEERLGVEVDYLPVKSYPAAVTAFRLGQVQLAWFGGLTGVQARRLVPHARAIAQGEEDRAFKSYFIAHASTGLEPMAELDDRIRGLSFTFGSAASTSGRLMPEYFLRRRFGVAPEAIFSRVGFSGDHSMTIAQVQSGAWQLGAVNYLVWEEAVAAGRVDPRRVQVIWQTPPYPDYHWTIRGDVDATFGEGFAKRVREALLALDDPAILAAFPRRRFVSAKDADYRPLEEIAEALGLLP